MIINNKKSLVLRSCPADMKTYNGFQWPDSGIVEAPDWNPIPKCGNGLHGFLNGEGDGDLAYWGDTKWLVLSVDTESIVDLYGKVKFPKCEILFCGTRKDATDYLAARVPGKAIIGYIATSGDYGTSVSGYMGTSVSGNYGKSITGDKGKSITSDRGTSASGTYGTSTSGDNGTSTSSSYGKSISGDKGKSITSDNGTSTSGDYGTSISGYSGKSITGNYGTSTLGYNGQGSSGVGGRIIINYWDKRYKIQTGYVKDENGENGDLLPNVLYKLNDKFEFEAIKDTTTISE